MDKALMQYYDAQPQTGGAGKYRGAVAAGYDAQREQSPKWLIEQRVIQDMLADLPGGVDENGKPRTVVFDCPVGTGRFLPFYVEKGFYMVGMDISVDMLRQAEIKVRPVAAKAMGELRQGDIRATQLPDKSVDVAVNCRITRWLSPTDCQQMLREMQRIACQRIIWTARVANHVHARSLELFEQALDGWEIVRNEAGVDLDYRILQARPI